MSIAPNHALIIMAYFHNRICSSQKVYLCFGAVLVTPSESRWSTNQMH